MQDYPEFRFAYSQPASYEAVERRAPGLYRSVRKRIRSGQWQATGAMYVESDTLLACGVAALAVADGWRAESTDLSGRRPGLPVHGGKVRFSPHEIISIRLQKKTHIMRPQHTLQNRKKSLPPRNRSAIRALALMPALTAAVALGIACAPSMTRGQEKGAENLARNGGFEAGLSGWAGPGLKSGLVVSENPADGANCFKLTGGFLLQEKMPVEGGKRYKVTMKIRGEDAPEGSVYVQLSYRGEGVGPDWVGPDVVKVAGRTEKTLFTAGALTDWQEFSAVIQPPATANELVLYLRKAAGTPGAAYFDDIKIEPTDEKVTTAADLKREKLSKEWLSLALPEAKAKAGLERIIAAAKQDAPKSHVLAKDGTVAYQVHVGTNSDLVTLNAAHDLAEYLGKICGGAAPSLSHDARPATGPVLVVGKDNAIAEKLCPDVEFSKLGEDGFVIRSVGPNIVIAGNTPGGTMYGVNWFLDHKLGVKWLTPDYTHVPAAKTIEVASLDEKQIPRFAFRQILSNEGDTKPFGARNLLNGNSHGAFGILSPVEIDHWDPSWQHPGLVASFYDLVPDRPGLRAGGQVAMMNPEVRKVMAEGIIKRLKAVPNYGNYWFGLMDNDWGWDIDPESAAFAKKHGGVASAAKTDMAIDVLKRVREVLPDAKIAFNAYHWGFTPPTGMTIPDGLLVYPMTIHLDYSTPLNRGRNEKLGKDIEGWNAIAKDILLWDHVTNFNGYIQPTPNIFPICETIRWLATLPNIHGYFAEGSWNTKSAEFAALRAWIMARMLWDPDTDYKAAIAEYCDAYFGPAGKIVMQYIDLMHEASVKSRAEIWEKTNVDSAMFTLDFVTKADALFDKAEAAVAGGDPDFLKHVRQARAAVDYVILLRRKDYEGLATKQKQVFKTDFDNRLARFDQTVKDEKISQFRQGGNMKELANIIAIDRQPSKPPELVRGLPDSDWREVQDIGFNRYVGSIEADPAASDGAAARVNGHDGGWWIQLKHHKLPEEGLWDIYAEVRVDEEPGAAVEDFGLGLGSAPPMNLCKNIKIGDLKKGAYQLIKAPGGPFRYNPDDGAISYIRGGSKKVKYINVDRFILVRAKEPVSQ